MGVRDVVIKIIGDSKSAEKALKDTEKASSGLDALTHKLRQLGPAGQDAASKLDKLGTVAGLSGSSLALGLAAGATAAGGALVALAAHAIGTYTELVNKVDQFQDVTGASAETSSRLVSVFEQFGVSSERASAAMFKLSRAASDNADGLAALGIEVAKNKDGTTDLEGTLFNVVRAYNSTQDAATKNKIAFTAFGKSGADLIDVLEVNDQRLRQLAKSAQNVFSQEDIDRVKEYKRQQTELGQAWDHLSATAGQKLLPATSALSAAFTLLLQGQSITAASVADYTAKLAAQGFAQGNLEQATRQAAQALADQSDELQRGIDLSRGSADATLGLVDAGLRQREAALGVERAQVSLNEAIRDHGVKSAEAREAQVSLERAIFNQAQAMIAAAKQAAEASVAQRGLGEGADAARYAMDEERKSLQRVAESLAPGSPVRVLLESYIRQLSTLPRDITTTVRFRQISEGSAPGNIAARAHGGRVYAGQTALLGEEGAELVRFDRPGTVIPAAATRRALRNGAPAQGSTTVYDLTVHNNGSLWDESKILSYLQDFELLHG
jgi:hypothetical protein